MKQMIVLIEARPFSVIDNAPMEALKRSGIQFVDMRGAGVDQPRFVAALKDSSIVLCGNELLVNESFFQLSHSLKAIAKLGVGLDSIDVNGATKRGIVVFHTPGANTHAVADHAFALMLSAARKILYCDLSLREKRWEHTKILGIELWQKTLGLIGLGAIGRGVAMRGKGFDMKVVAYDPFWPNAFAEQHQIEKMEAEELLKVSDFISIHSPLTPENRGFINKRTLSLMKPTALLINTARGEIVNEADLYSALKSGVIAGAGIDVFEQEPPVNSPLLELENVVLTPHTAAFTRDALKNMSRSIADQIIEYVNGNRPKHIVNPEAWKAA